MNKGVCYGVSVGPGDKGLITNEALEIIEKSETIFLPSFPKEECQAYKIIKRILPDIDRKIIHPESFIMTKDSFLMSERHREIFLNLTKILDQGRNIAFLTLGDVAIYSTYLYIHRLLIENGYESVLINGISSIQAICARLNVPLSLGSEEVHIFPNADGLKEKLSCKGTRVFMKIKGNLEETLEKIKLFTESSGQIACGISNCGMEGEIIARDQTELDKLKGYFTVVLVFERSDRMICLTER